jgi:hypothetical protein
MPAVTRNELKIPWFQNACARPAALKVMSAAKLPLKICWSINRTRFDD